MEMTEGQRSPLAQPLLGRGEQEGSENISGSHQGGCVLGLSLPEAISAKVEKPWPCLQEEPDRKVCDLRQNPCFSAEVGQGPWAQLQAPGHQQRGRGAGFPWARCSHPPHLDSTALILQHREKIIRKKTLCRRQTVVSSESLLQYGNCFYTILYGIRRRKSPRVLLKCVGR